MNREIKFRAYDTGNKLMHYDVEFIRSGRENNDWIIFKSDKQTLKDDKVFDNPFFSAQIKIMQFVGVKDINGKNIYEGDIVRWGHLDGWSKERNHRYATVELDPDIQFKLLFCIDSNTTQKKQDRHIFRFGSFAYRETEKYLEVVGNIFENPELLEH